MAMTVIGFYNNFSQVLQMLEDLVANDYNTDYIKLVYQPGYLPPGSVNYDNTLEEAPVIIFKDVIFGAEISEEDCFYYAACLRKGTTLLTIYIPTTADQDREWETATAKTLGKFMEGGGAYDHEVHRVYGNRAGLTTYPQNRYTDPLGANHPGKDRTHDSRTTWDGEVSNTIGTLIKTDYLESLKAQSGLVILTATAALKVLDSKQGQKYSLGSRPAV